MEWFGKITDVLKLPLRYAVWCSIVSGLVLFLPTTWLAHLHLDAFVSTFGMFVGLFFLGSVTLVLVQGALKLRESRRSSVRYAASVDRCTTAVVTLDDPEKAVLREFFIRRSRTVRMPMDDPVVAALLSKGVLSRVGSVAEHTIFGVLVSLQISETAEPLVLPELLGLSHSPTSHERDWVLSQRPRFVDRVQDYERLKHGR